MNLTLSSEQLELQATVRRLLAERCPTTLVRAMRDGNGGSDFETLWKAVSTTGLLALGLPDAVGGGGGSMIDVGLVVEELGGFLAPTVIRSTIAFGLAVAAAGDEAMQKRWLPQVGDGALPAAVVLGAPGHTALMASPAADGWTVSGTLAFAVVPESCQAIAVSAFTRTGELLFVVARLDTPGTRRELHQALGTRDLCTLVFDRCAVAAEDAAVVTEAGDALATVRGIVAALEAIDAVGGSQAVLDRTVEYITGRVQFGRPIGSFQAPQHHVANVSIAIDSARLSALQALWTLDGGEAVELDIAVARALAARTYKETTLRAHQLHGGMGMTLEYDLHLWSERAKLGELVGESWDDIVDRLGDALASGHLSPRL